MERGERVGWRTWLGWIRRGNFLFAATESRLQDTMKITHKVTAKFCEILPKRLGV